MPAPFRPMSATRSPGSSRSEMPRRIVGPSWISCHTPFNSSAGCVPRPLRRSNERRARGFSWEPCRSSPEYVRISATSSGFAVRRAAWASFTDAGNGLSPASEKSRAAGVASAGGDWAAAQSRNSRGAASQHHAAVRHRDHAVGGRQAALQTVLRHDDRGSPVLVEPPQLPDELVAGHGVELGGRLVQDAGAAGRAPSPPRSPRAAARPRRACRCGARAGAPRRAPEPSPRPPSPPSPPARPDAPAAARAPRARRPSPPVSRAPGRPCRTRRRARPARGRARRGRRREARLSPRPRGSAGRARRRRAEAWTSRSPTRPRRP